MSHGDEAKKLPDGFALTARTSTRWPASPMRRDASGQCSSTPKSRTLARAWSCSRNFVLDICGAKPDWTPEHFIQATVGARARPGGRWPCHLRIERRRRLQSVAAVLVARAIGDRLTCIFVNNGVLRKDEFGKVQKTMREQLGLHVVAVDASERFSRLAGVTDPETSAKSSATNSSRSSTRRPDECSSGSQGEESPGWCRAPSIRM